MSLLPKWGPPTMAVAAVLAVGMPGAGPLGGQPGGSQGTIVAQWSSPATGKEPVLELISVSTGRPEGELARLPAALGYVAGPFTGQDGAMWYTDQSGPKLRCSGCMESSAIPNTCKSAVVRLAPRSAQAETVFTAPSSETIQDAVPSPNGAELAYMEQGCTTGSDMHYVLRDLKSGKQVDVGAGNVPCHLATGPSWSPNGRQLVFTWGTSSLRPGTPPPSWGLAGPACQQPHLAELAVVPTDRSGPVVAPELHAAPQGCAYMAASYDSWGIVVVEDCGGDGGWLGSARLVQLSPRLGPISSLSLPARPDGVTLAASANGRQVLVDEYQAAAPGSPGNVPTEWLLDFNGRALRTIIQDRTGVDSLEFAAWY